MRVRLGMYACLTGPVWPSCTYMPLRVMILRAEDDNDDDDNDDNEVLIANGASLTMLTHVFEIVRTRQSHRQHV